MPAPTSSSASRRPFRASVADIWADLRGTKTYHRYRELEDRRRRVAGRVLLFVNIVAGIVYIAWFASVLNMSVWYATIPFLGAEVVGLITSAAFAFIIWHPRFHRAEGATHVVDADVDILVTTCGEPLAVLERTLRAAVAIDWPRARVWVLDDRQSAAVEALAAETGCRYVARPSRENAKAGNLNYGLAQTSAPFLLTLDADQVPDSEIVRALLGYFAFPQVAFVQSEQRFRVTPRNPFAQCDDLFYKVMQSGKDTDNSAFSCGSGVMYRRAALADIGGFSTWNLVEDLHTSMRLHAAGWRSVYHNHALSTGSAPAELLTFCTQREQWATDSLRILFWDNPYKYRGLTPKQRFQYFQIGFQYLTAAFAMPVYFLIPAWSFFTGGRLVDASVRDYAIVRGLYFVCGSVASSIIERPINPAKPYKIWAGLFPQYARAAVRALATRTRKPGYEVTGASGRKLRRGFPRALTAAPQFTIVALTVAGMLYAARFHTVSWPLFVINCVWGAWSIWSLSTICLAALRPGGASDGEETLA